MSNNPRAGAPLKNIVEQAESKLESVSGLEAEVIAGQPDLGPLTDLQGDWVGRGFSIVALPDFHNKNPFRLLVNSTMEFLEFKPVTAPIPNRGNTQDDISFLGFTYIQKVNDAETSETLHFEPGIWLHLPENKTQNSASVVRMSTIPHGDSLLAQGPFFDDPTGPRLSDVDAIPFTLDAKGNRVNDPFQTYLAPYTNTPLPPGIPPGSILNPTLVLRENIKKHEEAGRKVVRTITLLVHANPVGGINGTSVNESKLGGILNIPFVVQNANANSLSAIFWIETIQNQDGSQFLQLQYTQTVILDFPVKGPNGQLFPIKWPHIAVGSLLKG